MRTTTGFAEEESRKKKAIPVWATGIAFKFNRLNAIIRNNYKLSIPKAVFLNLAGTFKA
jgi:hypothetical protein